MGVSAKKLCYDFRRKFNSINSGRNQDVALVDIIAYLNEAQEIWFEHRAYVAQTDQKVRNDLRVFKKDKVELACRDYEKGCCFARYPKELFKRLNQIALTRNECCEGIEKEIIPRILQSDDLHEARHNPYRRADYFFEQLSAIETKSGLVVYHDGAMDVLGVYIDYYRRPKEIHAPSLEKCNDGAYYDYCGRVIKRDQDFEVDDTYAANDVVDIAVLKASRDVSDPEGFSTQLQAILNIEKLHK